MGTGMPLADVISAVEVRSIRLTHLAAQSRAKGPEEFALPVTPAVKVGVDDPAEVTEGGNLIVHYSVTVTVLSHDMQEDPLLSVYCKFELVYSLHSGAVVDSETRSAFARMNGAYNAWPYARELVQSTTARMGLPSLVLPALRVGTRTQPKRDDTEPGSASSDGAMP